MSYFEQSLELHKKYKGKLEISSCVSLKTKEDLSVAYTPGVAQPCREIAKDESLAYEYTIKGRSVAVVTDGSAVLGLGNIGPKAALPVMEGKAILFKAFANIDAYPICLNTQDVDEIVETVKRISPGFGGINLEDISAPRCFEIEKRLIEELDIPVMHDDQHGTAVVVLAGLFNALKLADKKLSEIKVVINGAGAAAMGTARILEHAGVGEMIILDSKGILCESREGMNEFKTIFAKKWNPKMKQGNLFDALVEADVFIGLSQPGVLKSEMIKNMKEKSIIFAMANPTPEIFPDEAKQAGAFIVATGRSDFSNQVNNVLAFPGLFKSALFYRFNKFTDEMRIQCAKSIASSVELLDVDHILPSVFNHSVVEKIVEDFRAFV